MSHRNTPNWPFPEETRAPSLDRLDDECRESTTSTAHTDTEIIRPDYRNRALVGRIISPSQIPQPKSLDDRLSPKLSPRSYVRSNLDHQQVTMRPISEDSFVAVSETDNMSETGAGTLEESGHSTMLSAGDVDDVVSKYPSGHDMGHIWEDDDEEKTDRPGGARAITLAVSSFGQTQPQHDDDAVGNTSAVDLSSGTSATTPTMTRIRRGPRIRHDRLLRSETMATTQRAIFGPDEEALTANQLRAKDRIYHVLILLSTIFMSASVTLLVTCSVVLSLFEKHIVEDNQDLVADKGALIACIAMGAIGTVVGFSLVCFVYFNHAGSRKTTTHNDGNSWIEMAHRNKPLPRIPGLLAENPNPKAGWDDPKANEAWAKLYNDEDGFRRYVEALEMRYSRLKEEQDGGSESGRPKPPAQDHVADATTTGRASRAANNGQVEHRTNVPSPLAQVTNNRDSNNTTSAADKGRDGDKTKVSIRDKYRHAAKGSISAQALIRSPSDSETAIADPADTADGHELRHSVSQASILTVLCDAVTQPYSPLGERIDTTITPSSPEASIFGDETVGSSSRAAKRLRRVGLIGPPAPAPDRSSFSRLGATTRDSFSLYLANPDDSETGDKGKGKAD